MGWAGGQRWPQAGVVVWGGAGEEQGRFQLFPKGDRKTLQTLSWGVKLSPDWQSRDQNQRQPRGTVTEGRVEPWEMVQGLGGRGDWLNVGGVLQGGGEGVPWAPGLPFMEIRSWKELVTWSGGETEPDPGWWG